jgi:hypothetical protein
MTDEAIDAQIAAHQAAIEALLSLKRARAPDPRSAIRPIA